MNSLTGILGGFSIIGVYAAVAQNTGPSFYQNPPLWMLAETYVSDYERQWPNIPIFSHFHSVNKTREILQTKDLSHYAFSEIYDSFYNKSYSTEDA